MAIYATPLLKAPPLPPIENGVEVLICEARLAHSATNDPKDYNEWQLMTVLVLIDASPEQRSAARSLAESYISAQSSFYQQPLQLSMDDWLSSLLHIRDAASLCLVISLPLVYEVETSRLIGAVLAKIRARNHHHLELAVAVGLQPADWMACGGVNGFVASSAEGVDCAAINTFKMLAALMAPGLSAALDADDLRLMFGTPMTPAQVAYGVWFPAKKIFMSASANDRDKIKNCQAAAFMPSRPLPLSSQHELTKVVRQLARKTTNLVVIAPYMQSSDQFFTSQIVTVIFLLRVFAEKTVYSQT